MLLSEELCSDVCVGLTHIGSVLTADNVNWDFGEVASSLLFDSSSVLVFFISEVSEVTSTPHNEQCEDL